MVVGKDIGRRNLMVFYFVLMVHPYVLICEAQHCLFRERGLNVGLLAVVTFAIPFRLI